MGAFYSRDGVDYRTFEIAGLEDVPTYGIDGPPALGVILACVGGFGKRPDMVLSGINHGVNVGRSALHSGTIGAVLTAAQFGIRGLATSIRYGPDPVPWETASQLARALVPVLQSAPTSTVLNLNVPECLTERTSRRAAPRDSDVAEQFALSHMRKRSLTTPRILQTPHDLVLRTTLTRRCRLLRAERCDSTWPYRVLRDKKLPQRTTTWTSTRCL